MPKCAKCGKKFQTLSALNYHYKAVHPNERFVAPKTSSSRNLLTGLVIAIIVIAALVGVLIYYSTSHGQTNTTPSATTTATTPFLNQPTNNTLNNDLTGVSSSTLASVGKGSASNSGMSKPGESPLTLNGKPEILFIGADYCPYCAIERWALAVALSRFGTLSGMEYMLSSAKYGNISTVTFSSVTYTSNYIAFQPVETEDRSSNALQTPTQAQQTVLTQYDSAESLPFVDIFNSYVIVGAQYAPASLTSNVFTGLSWSQIGLQLNTPSSSIAQAVDGSANYLISMICSVDKDQPSSVCGQSFAQLLSCDTSSCFGSNGGTSFYRRLCLAVPIKGKQTYFFDMVDP